jgi:hypothetical protein
MTIRYCQNVSVPDDKVQALLYYYWFVFCNEFPEVAAVGVWDTGSVSGTQGIINSTTPSSFYSGSVSEPFLMSYAGWYIAIRDNTNPSNTTIAEILTVVSSTEITLAPGAILDVSSTNVSYRLIDPSVLPGVGDYFVISNRASLRQPPWQAKINANSNYVSVVFAPIGGWDVNTSLWQLPVCVEHFMHDTVAYLFMATDPENGWTFNWTEESGGGSSAYRKSMWFGSLTPLHSPGISGLPSDNTYGAIFGDPVDASDDDNIGLDVTVSTKISSGQTMNSSLGIVSLYWAHAVLYSSLTAGHDILPSPGQNPKSGEVDAYEVVAFQSTPNAIRGKVPGMRIVNLTGLTNRELYNSGLTYVLDDGIALVWNNKAAV